MGWASLAGQSRQLPEAAEQARPDDLAYIMFTSGSTGRPKGITHTHASGLSYARLAADTYALAPDDRIASFAPLHVDQCTFALFAGPRAGATSVVVPDAVTGFPIDLARLIEAQRISIWYSVPLPLTMLLEGGDLRSFDHSALRWVTYGGEPFPVPTLRALMDCWPWARFSNVYGPAEVNQCTFYHFGREDLPPDDRPVPLGRVWPETQGLVVDAAGAEVSPGETGELLIHSSTMMRGYWERPDLDASAFVTIEREDNPLRFYRTGDLVYYDDAGLLQFVGRRDHQVKVRGWRVELEAVDAALVAFPEVGEAAAFVTGAPASMREIAAAVTGSSSLDIGALHRHLGRVLPSHACPVAIRVVDELPRTNAGKVDRQALMDAYGGPQAGSTGSE